MLVNSPSAVSTSAPARREAATRPANTLTWLPTATVDGVAPTRFAYSTVPSYHCDVVLAGVGHAVAPALDRLVQHLEGPARRQTRLAVLR